MKVRFEAEEEVILRKDADVGASARWRSKLRVEVYLLQPYQLLQSRNTGRTEEREERGEGRADQTISLGRKERNG